MISYLCAGPGDGAALRGIYRDVGTRVAGQAFDEDNVGNGGLCETEDDERLSARTSRSALVCRFVAYGHGSINFRRLC